MTYKFMTPLFVFSGPSGCGKTTICRLLEARLGAYYSVSYTTRPKRPGEVNGKDYFFVTPHEFHDMITRGDFLEWEEVHDNLYGTPKKPIIDRLTNGELVVLDVDVNGALSVKRLLPDAVLVFISPPSWEELEARLIARAKDAPEVIEKRLINARKESDAKTQYDHIIINDDLETTYHQIATLIRS